LADWEFLVPGLGLTILGLLGVVISLSGIAKTFEEGMHAISAVAMLFGMILLAAGILKGGLPRSNEAKAATIFIVGILAALGGLLAGISNVTTLPLLIGVIFLILAPATIIALLIRDSVKGKPADMKDPFGIGEIYYDYRRREPHH
jgi:uncharacterized membrane protein